MERISLTHLKVFGMFSVAFVLCGCAYAYSLMGQMLPAVLAAVLSLVLTAGIFRASVQSR